MKFFVVLALAAVALAEPEADPQILIGSPKVQLANGLVQYPDGAVTPRETPEVEIATANHFAAKGFPFAPYYVGAHFIGKREADAQFLVAYPNGAVTPVDTPEVQIARANHFAAKGYLPYAHYIGKRDAEDKKDDEKLLLDTSLPLFNGLYVHPNGAVTPAETSEVEQAKAAHFKAQGYKLVKNVPVVYATHFIGKREAEGEKLLVDPAFPLFNGLVAYPDGAVTPPETRAVEEAKAKHYEAKGYKLVKPAPFVYSHFIGKREADPQIYVTPTAVTTPVVAPVATYAYGFPYAYNGYRFIGKREAEPKSQFYYGTYGLGYSYPYYGYGYYG